MERGVVPERTQAQVTAEQWLGDRACRVYALVDTRDVEEPRYIGITSKSLRARLAQHLEPKSTDHTHRANWIREVLRDGAQVRILSYAVVDRVFARQLEAELISAFRRHGARLTNSTAGGDDGVDRHLPEVRQRIGASVRTTFIENPHIGAAHSQRMKHKYATDPAARAKLVAQGRAQGAMDDAQRAAHGRRISAWWTTERRHSRSEVSRRYWASQETRDAQSRTLTGYYADATVRGAHGEAVRNGIARMTPEAKRQKSERLKSSWARRKTAAESEGRSE